MPKLEPLSPRLMEEFKAVRLRALEDTPTAFGSTYAKESVLSDSDWLKRVDTWNGRGAFAIWAWIRVPRVASSPAILTKTMRKERG